MKTLMCMRQRAARARRNFGFELLKLCLTFGYLTCSVRSKKNSTLHPNLQFVHTCWQTDYQCCNFIDFFSLIEFPGCHFVIASLRSGLCYINNLFSNWRVNKNYINFSLIKWQYWKKKIFYSNGVNPSLYCTVYYRLLNHRFPGSNPTSPRMYIYFQKISLVVFPK